MKVIVIDVSTEEELKSVLDVIASRQDLALEFPKAEVPAEEPKPEASRPEEPAPEVEPSALEQPIEDLAIPSRIVKVLHEKHIDTVPALTSLRERDLKRIPQIGQASLREIKNALHKKGLRLRRRDFKGAA
jgi:DNA-directed RNA polymerase subunit alpha